MFVVDGVTVKNAMRGDLVSCVLYTWFLQSGNVREISEGQGKSGHVQVPGCKS